MNDLGGYAPQLDFAIGAALGQSPLLPQTCVGAITGTSNPDGQCVLGGRTTRSGTCDATPIFVQNMVPYTSGGVSGVRYDLLHNLKSSTRLNQSALLQNLRRTSA